MIIKKNGDLYIYGGFNILQDINKIILCVCKRN